MRCGSITCADRPWWAASREGTRWRTLSLTLTLTLTLTLVLTLTLTLACARSRFPRSLAEGETRQHERRKPKRVAGAKRRRDADWYASGDEDDCFTKEEQKLRLARWRAM